jgi:hypothetical protein
MTPSDRFVLPRADFEALLARSERELRSKKRRLKTAPTPALEQEVDLLARQVKQMRFMDRFYPSSLRSGPRELLDTVAPLLPRLHALPFAWLMRVGIDLTRTAEGVSLYLKVEGSFRVEPGLVPGVPDVLAMRFYDFDTNASGATVEEAFDAAERHVVEQMSKHPSQRSGVDV